MVAVASERASRLGELALRLHRPQIVQAVVSEGDMGAYFIARGVSEASLQTLTRQLNFIQRIVRQRAGGTPP